MTRHLMMQVTLGGILVIGGGVGWMGWHQAVFAASNNTAGASRTSHIPAPKTFKTNQLPIPAVARSVPTGALPSSVTVTAGKARAVAIQWIEAHRPTKQIVPPVITGVTLMTRSAVEQKAGAQAGLSTYLWQVNFRSTDFELFGSWPRGTVYVNTVTGTVPIAHGAAN